MVDHIEEEEGDGERSSSDDSESSVDFLNSPSKGGSNRESKEIGEDDGLDKRSDVDKKLAHWVYSVFVPACHALLTHCSSPTIEAHQVMDDLKNVSNLIASFCDQHQRPGPLTSSPGLDSPTDTLSTLSQHEQSTKVNGTTPGLTGTTPGLTGTPPGLTGTTPGLTGTTPGLTGTTPGLTGTTPGLTSTTPGLTGTTPGQAAESVVFKALRSATYTLMGPLLCLAQRDCNQDLIKQIVEALQKVSWKVEACLSYSSPDQGHSVHAEVFDPTHAAMVAPLMIKARPPEEGKINPPAGKARSNSVAIRKTSSVSVTDGERSGEERAHRTSTKSTSLDENEHFHWLPVPAPSSPEDGQAQGGDKRVSQVSQVSQEYSSSGTDRDGSAAPSDKGEMEGAESDYFRPRVYRRTTVSLSKAEVDHLGLNAAKGIGEWEGAEGQGVGQRGAKFYQRVGRNLNAMSKKTDDGGQAKGYEEEPSTKEGLFMISSSFEDVPLPPEGVVSSTSEVTKTFNGSDSSPLTPSTPVTPMSPDWRKDPLSSQAPVPRRPVKKTKSDLSSRKDRSKKDLQRNRSEKMLSIDLTQSLQLHGDPASKGGAKGGAGEKQKANTLSKLRKSFGSSDKKIKKRDEVTSDVTEQDGFFFENVEHFSKEKYSSSPLGECG